MRAATTSKKEEDVAAEEGRRDPEFFAYSSNAARFSRPVFFSRITSPLFSTIRFCYEITEEFRTCAADGRSRRSIKASARYVSRRLRFQESAEYSASERHRSSRSLQSCSSSVFRQHSWISIVSSVLMEMLFKVSGRTALPEIPVEQILRLRVLHIRFRSSLCETVSQTAIVRNSRNRSSRD